MGFKGTKGKWEYYKYTPTVEAKSLLGLGGFSPEGKHEVFLAYGRTAEQAKANAQLSSKAPEMLEMLENLKTLFQKNYSVRLGIE